jgi:hypothetical protein
MPVHLRSRALAAFSPLCLSLICLSLLVCSDLLMRCAISLTTLFVRPGSNLKAIVSPVKAFWQGLILCQTCCARTGRTLSFWLLAEQVIFLFYVVLYLYREWNKVQQRVECGHKVQQCVECVSALILCQTYSTFGRRWRGRHLCPTLSVVQDTCSTQQKSFQ